MSTHFDRWEKDPFFSAAEEVQESADRMESTYRTWIHAVKDSSSMWNSEELRRDLHTALGTTKWQLEEFERAVRSGYTSNNAVDDAKERHSEFIIAMGNQISKVENALNESAVSAGKPPRPWVRLDEGECDELALFLSGSKSCAKLQLKEQRAVKLQEFDKQSSPGCSKNSSGSVEWGLLEAREEKLSGHRRAASASADIGAYQIAVDDVSPQSSSNAQPNPPPRKIPSFSGFLNTMESASKLKWSKNGYRKLKLPDSNQEAADTALSQSQNVTKGINACYERNKSCLDGCDDCYDKQLYTWYGAIQRQLQRSQYHVQYSRPIRMLFWSALLICLIILFAVCGI